MVIFKSFAYENGWLIHISIVMQSFKFWIIILYFIDDKLDEIHVLLLIVL